ncbi:MAG: ABC transporter ATP-binding protein, partial [Proteobacteria bacterium]|nr:ABC transporter ATP-binding protein [Pseudomonadota bacterium]
MPDAGVRIGLDAVSRSYGTGVARLTALKECNLVIGAGDLLAIVGPSGSGKSTLLQLIGLLDQPSEGRILFDGQDIAGFDDGARTRMRLHEIGFVFQRFHLLMGVTALENVAIPMEAAGISAAVRHSRASELLDRVGLGDRLLAMPAQLSGGQRQRVAIARALANGARLILADEPTGALHSEDKAGVIALL